MVDEDMVQREYCWRQLANMKQLCRRFNTAGQTQSALEAAVADRDSFANAVRCAAQTLISAGTDNDSDTGWWSLATVEGVTFLGEFLPADAYRALFDALQGLPAEGDPKALNRRCRALSALAYGGAVEGRLDRAAVPAATAYDLLPWVDEETQAFCLLCLAVVCRSTDAAKAATLARRSLEVYRGLDQPCACSPPERIRVGSFGTTHALKPHRGSTKPPRMGVKAIHVQERPSSAFIPPGDQVGGEWTPHDLKFSFSGGNSSRAGTGIIHAAELLASILADAGSIQSALNACRQSDEAGFQALHPGHPLAVQGYLVRQRLWTSLGLTERARLAAVKAAEAALVYYSEEHPETGHALARLCESSSLRGPVDDAICDAIHALAVRIKVGSYFHFIYS